MFNPFVCKSNDAYALQRVQSRIICASFMQIQ